MIAITRTHLGSLAVVVVVVAGLTQVRPISAAPVSVTTPVTEGACVLHCAYQPYYCASGQHDAFVSSGPTASGQEHDGEVCWNGTCGAPLHPWCGLPESVGSEALERLRLAVLRNDFRGLKKLLAEHPSLTLNRERSAIQMTVCDQSIGLHLPIPASLLAAL